MIRKQSIKLYRPPTFELVQIEYEQDLLGGSGEFSDIPELGGIEWP